MLQFDKPLLASWPVIWRTGVLHVLWWSLIGYCALCVLGALVEVEPKDTPTIATLDFYAVVIWVPVVFAMAYWMFSLWRIAPPRLNWRTFLGTLLLYFICLYVGGAVPTGFNHILSSKIAATQPNDHEFEGDYNAMARYKFGLCLGPADDQVKQTIAKVSQKYGLSASFDETIPCDISTTACPSQSCAAFSNENGIRISDEALSDRMHLVKWTKDFANGLPNEVSSRSSFLDRDRAILFVLLSLLMATCHLSGSAYEPIESERRFSWRNLIPGPKRFVTKYIISWDRRLVITRPYLWSAGIHIVFVYNLLIYIISIFVVAAIVAVSIYLKASLNYVSYISLYSILFFLPPILLISIFRFDRQFEFHDPSSHILYLCSRFFSSSLIIFLIFSISLFFSTSNIELSAIIASSGVFLAHGIYMASNFSYASKLWDMKLASFGALFSILMYLFLIFVAAMFFVGDFTYIALASIFVIPITLVCIFYLATRIRASISVYLLVFSLFATPSISLLVSIFVFFLLLAFSINDYLGLPVEIWAMAGIILMAFLPIILTLTIYRPVFRALHRIYVSPSDS